MNYNKIRNFLIPTIVFILLTVLMLIIQNGLELALTFLPALLIAYIMYLYVSYPSDPSYERVIPVYLLALAVQFLHFAEEYVYDFGVRWPVEIFHTTAYSDIRFVVTNMVSYAFFILGAVAMYKKIKPLMLIVWFYTIMGVVVNSISHTIYAIMVGRYFPGLFTSFIQMILGPILIMRLWETKKKKQAV